MGHLTGSNVLTDVQHGFGKNRLCETQLITTCNDFAENLNNSQQTDAILLDFSKAFDKVHHQSLLIKMHHYGIRGKLHEWIDSFLGDRSQLVVLDGQSSHIAPVLSGVPQGTVMGPLLFLIYINDMPNRISSKSKLRLFADDSLLYRTINSTQDGEELQRDLNKLQDWEQEWRMQFHPQKCQVLTISNKKKNIRTDYTIHGVKLEEVNSAKYLGVTLDSHLNWKQHIDNTSKKANSTLAFLMRNIITDNLKIKEKCYKAFVLPTLEYSSSTWDPYTQVDIDKLEKVQRRSARFVVNNYDRRESVTSILDELKWTPLKERRAKSKVKLLYKGRNKLLHIPLSHLGGNNRKANLNYHVPSSRVNAHLYSFYPNVVRLWNNLPVEAKFAESATAFENKISTVTLRCSYRED